MKGISAFGSITRLALLGSLAVAQPIHDSSREKRQEHRAQERRHPRNVAPPGNAGVPRELTSEPRDPRPRERHRNAAPVADVGQLPRIRPPLSPILPRHEEAQTWQERGRWRQDAWQPRRTWREHRAKRWEVEHRTWSQRGGYGGYSIPEAHFRPAFGKQHTFRIGSRPVIYEGYPRFWCRGYWFLIVDPWPELWRDDWYFSDDVYIDYHLDGYYLFNHRYPGVGIAVTVSF